MRLICLLLLAGSWLKPGCQARPLYGGTFRAAFAQSFQSLSPSVREQAPGAQRVKDLVLPLVYESLVRWDASGKLVPGLASSWHMDDAHHWRFELRPGLKLHSGEPLTVAAVASSLRRSLTHASVTASNEAVSIELNAPDSDLPSELTTLDTAIAVGSDSIPDGTGPFQIKDWQPGKSLTLSAFAGHRDGRPFLDGVEIRFGITAKVQSMQLLAGSLDLAEVEPQDSRARELRPVNLFISAPQELLALVCPEGMASACRALSSALDRGAIQKVLLQGRGEVSGAILPEWLSGYAFRFATARDLDQARKATPAELRIGFPASDRLAQLIAERAALDGREAGLAASAGITRAGTIEAHVVRIPVPSMPCGGAVTRVLAELRIPEPSPPSHEGYSQACYERESHALASGAVVPIAHLPLIFGLGSAVRDWPRNEIRISALPLDQIWLDRRRP